MMVVSSLAEKSKRGREASAAARRGLTKEEYGLWHVPFLERIDAKQFERWLMKRFGEVYLSQVHLFKDGGGI